MKDSIIDDKYSNIEDKIKNLIWKLHLKIFISGSNNLKNMYY
jgi:hypothetical protein